jgi:(p)ppGpp synthase/HD superfamily hydrolase
MTPEQSRLYTIAIQVAAQIHKNHRDKAGEPYILHCLKVSEMVKTFEERVAAILHDVIEDGDLRPGDLKQMGFPDEIVEIVDIVSRRDGETYESFIDRIIASENVHAMWVKMADLTHNTDRSRLPPFDRQAQIDYDKRMKRYGPAFQKLAEAVQQESKLRGR